VEFAVVENWDGGFRYSLLILYQDQDLGFLVRHFHAELRTLIRGKTFAALCEASSIPSNQNSVYYRKQINLNSEQ
jgi:hypothetical protein